MAVAWPWQGACGWHMQARQSAAAAHIWHSGWTTKPPASGAGGGITAVLARPACGRKAVRSSGVHSTQQLDSQSHQLEGGWRYSSACAVGACVRGRSAAAAFTRRSSSMARATSLRAGGVTAARARLARVRQSTAVAYTWRSSSTTTVTSLRCRWHHNRRSRARNNQGRGKEGRSA